MASSVLAALAAGSPRDFYHNAAELVSTTPLGAHFNALFTAAAPFLLRVPALDGAAASLNEVASLGSDAVARMLVAMALAYPLGAVQPWLPGAALRHLWSLAVGVYFVQYVFGVGYLHVLLPAAAVYVLLAVMRAVGVLAGSRHAVAAIAAFAYLIFRNLARLVRVRRGERARARARTRARARPHMQAAC